MPREAVSLSIILPPELAIVLCCVIHVISTVYGRSIRARIMQPHVLQVILF
jgi:hypothetical protein